MNNNLSNVVFFNGTLYLSSVINLVTYTGDEVTIIKVTSIVFLVLFFLAMIASGRDKS